MKKDTENENSNEEHAPVLATPLWKRAIGWIVNLFYFSIWLLQFVRWLMALPFILAGLYLTYGWIFEYLIYGAPKFYR